MEFYQINHSSITSRLPSLEVSVDHYLGLNEMCKFFVKQKIRLSRPMKTNICLMVLHILTCLTMYSMLTKSAFPPSRQASPRLRPN